MFKLFSRRRKAEREIAPQLTTYERRALEIPGAPPGPYSLATYDLMERDSMIQTALTIKKLAVMAENWTVEPADGSSEAKERADFVLAAFDRMEGVASTILHQAMDAFAKGWSIQELVYTNENGPVWLAAVRPKNPGLFGLEVNAFGKVSGLRLQIPGEAEESLPRDKFIIFTHRSGYGRAKGKSDLDSAYPHWKSKQTLLNAWRIHLERYPPPRSSVGTSAASAPRSKARSSGPCGTCKTTPRSCFRTRSRLRRWAARATAQPASWRPSSSTTAKSPARSSARP